MADLSGWHPDPGGARGRYRYWDGRQWSAETTTDPRSAPPGPPPAPPRRSRGGLVAAVVAGLVLVALLALVARFVVGIWPVTVDPAPPPTVVGDDSSPTASPSPTPSPTPTPRSPTPTPSAAPRSSSARVPCPLGLPNLRAAHPVDGRVHGGNLSFPAEPTFRLPVEEPRMTFAYDVFQQSLPVNATPGWIAQLAVGQLRAESGFVHDTRNTADSLVECLVTGPLYDPHEPTRADRRSEATTVSGRAAWLIESHVTVVAPGLPFPGDRVVVVVVPDGLDWGFFFGAAPIGDVGLNEVLDKAVAGLRVG